MREIWKTVLDGYDLEVSSLGSVKYNGKIRPCPSKKYRKITIVKEGVRKTYSIARLVAIAFIPNPDNKRCVNHKNGVKDDDKVENLEWATDSENIQHAYDTRLKSGVKGEKSHFAKLTNSQKRRLLELSNRVKPKELAMMYGLTIGHVHYLIRKNLES